MLHVIATCSYVPGIFLMLTTMTNCKHTRQSNNHHHHHHRHRPSHSHTRYSTTAIPTEALPMSITVRHQVSVESDIIASVEDDYSLWKQWESRRMRARHNLIKDVPIGPRLEQHMTREPSPKAGLRRKWGLRMTFSKLYRSIVSPGNEKKTMVMKHISDTEATSTSERDLIP